MSEQLNSCKKCNSFKLQIIKEIDPQTKKANMKVICKCETCGHEDEYFETSPYFKHLRSMGQIW